MIGHRFGHPLGQDESSGSNPAAIFNMFPFRIYLVASPTNSNTIACCNNTALLNQHTTMLVSKLLILSLVDIVIDILHILQIVKNILNNTGIISSTSTSRPLYGGGSGVCIHFVYVYIVLWFVGFLWVSSELISLSLEWLWLPFGFLGQPSDHFGPLWVVMKVAWVCLGAHSRFLTK